VRVAVGGPEENAFTAAVLEAADDAYAAELARQRERGPARVWVPAARPLADVWVPNADVRGARDLPVLIVTGDGALAALIGDLADAPIAVDQPADLDGATGRVEPYGVAVLNRGTPGFAVETSGDLYLSLMRSCSGWPSGIWIDPPRRTLPTGGSFQFQHWSHTFDYALVGHEGDWRDGEVVRRGHEYASPLLARVLDPHDGSLPPSAPLLEVDPARVAVTAVKPAGNPMARMAGTRMDPRDGLVVRAYETTGQPASATLRCRWPLRAAAATDVLEESRRGLPCADGAAALHLDGYGIATTWLEPATEAVPAAEQVDLGPRAERAQPAFTDYWRHNRGVAPMGYQPVTVQIAPLAVAADGPVDLPVVVASERTDEAVAGRLDIVAPPGWRADPPQRLFRLAPGAYLACDVAVAPAASAPPGRYFVAARITDEAGQAHEDVVTIDLGERAEPPRGRALSIDVATRKASLSAAPPETALHGELDVELVRRGVSLRPGSSGCLTVRLRNRAASEVRGEAQLLCPHELWPVTAPWTQGFAVGAGAEHELRFAVDPPAWFRPGAYWALVKVTYFGRRRYTEAVPVDVRTGGGGLP
jgi:alpha-mannosidase